MDICIFWYAICSTPDSTDCQLHFRDTKAESFLAGTARAGKKKKKSSKTLINFGKKLFAKQYFTLACAKSHRFNVWSKLNTKYVPEILHMFFSCQDNTYFSYFTISTSHWTTTAKNLVIMWHMFASVRGRIQSMSPFSFYHIVLQQPR